MSYINKKTLIVGLTILFTKSSWGLPVDWNGRFGVESIQIGKMRNSVPGTIEVGSQEILGTDQKAFWQSYIFQLNPTIVINDVAVLKSEFSTGYPGTSYLGKNSQISQNQQEGNLLYYHNSASATNNLNLLQANITLYSDTGAYIIGRHKFHWGLGALYNKGKSVWQRHTSIRDGATLNFKIGNVYINPYWSQTSKENLTTNSGTVEKGFSILYKNINRDIKFGVLYANKENKDKTKYFSGVTNEQLGETDVRILDFYLEKKISPIWDIALEIPLLSGNLGNVYSSNATTTYDAKGFILESHYKFNDKIDFDIVIGSASGEDGDETTFKALYLNPNYQIASILFNYNPQAITDSNKSIYDSYINNARFIKFASHYMKEKWTWTTSFLFAQANEVAKTGSQAFNHQTNKLFDANANQDKNLGYEIDLGFNYKWNTEINISGSLGYLFPGKYFAYTNTNAENNTNNILGIQFRTSVSF